MVWYCFFLHLVRKMFFCCSITAFVTQLVLIHIINFVWLRCIDIQLHACGAVLIFKSHQLFPYLDCNSSNSWCSSVVIAGALMSPPWCLEDELHLVLFYFHRASLWSSCVVLPLLALTWMSAVLAITDRRSTMFQVLFAVFDSVQGFVIITVHCAMRREVSRLLTRLETQ